jgi:hypothetical protein
MRSRSSLLAIGLIGVLLLSTACNSTEAAPSVASVAGAAGASEDAADSPDAGTAEADPEQAMLDFAACMREHGIDMPDPSSGGGALRLGANEDTDREAFEEAQEECDEHLEGLQREIDPAQRAEFEEAMLSFAQCMRDNGVDMPDPQMDGDGRVTMGGPGGPGGGIDPEDPAFQQAQEACQDIIAGARPGGPGGPGAAPGGGDDQ